MNYMIDRLQNIIMGSKFQNSKRWLKFLKFYLNGKFLWKSVKDGFSSKRIRIEGHNQEVFRVIKHEFGVKASKYQNLTHVSKILLNW